MLTNPCKVFVGLTHLGFFTRMDDERYLRLLYHGVLGRPIHLNPPVLYSEKMQWLKLHDKNPIYTQLCDKIAVREYVSRLAGEQYLIPLLGIWENPDQIDFDSLPNRFVLKCTHDSGSAILCADKSKFDRNAAKETLKKKLRRDYSLAGREWPYHDVPRRILAEMHLGDEDGTPPVDYKFFCFHGKVKLILIYVHQEDGNNFSYTFLPDFSEFPIYRNDDEQYPTYARPAHLDEMITIAETLSEGFAHMRVDLYDTVEGVKFGEITLHSSSGLSISMTERGEVYLGGMLQLEEMN